MHGEGSTTTTSSGEDGNSSSLNPPQGVFAILGVMELENQMLDSPSTTLKDGHQDDHDDDVESYNSGDEEDFCIDDQEEEEDASLNEDSFESNDVPGNNNDMLLPTFNSKGKFKDYETRDGRLEEGHQGWFNSGDNESSHRKKKVSNKMRYAIVMMLLVLSVVIVMIASLAGKGGKENEVPAPSKAEGTNNNEVTQNDIVANNFSGKEEKGDDGKIETTNNAAHRKIHMAPSAVACIRKSSVPDKDESHDQNSLLVENDESISLIQFNLSDLSENDVITKATLKLNLKSNAGAKEVSTIDVHRLKHNWSNDGSVSWDNLRSVLGLPHYANNFHVDADNTNQHIKVDVTSTMNASYETITFKLSTESSGIWEFASGKDVGPELVLTVMSQDTSEEHATSEEESNALDTKTEAVSDIHSAPSQDKSEEDTSKESSKSDVKTDALSNIHIIAPTTVACIRKSSPDGCYHQKSLLVKNDESISLIKFNLSDLSEHDVITKATLKLNLKSSIKPTDTNGESSKIDVHRLKHDWSNDGSISWDNLRSVLGLPHYTNNFHVDKKTSEVIEVDVTSTMNASYETITFKLSTESSGIWEFESGEDVGPELVVTLDK